MTTWSLLFLVVPLLIVVGLILANRLPAWAVRRLSPRRRRVLGAGFVLAGLGLLAGGQAFSLSAAKDRVAGAPPEVRIPVPLPGDAARGGPWLARFLTIGEGRPGELRLLEHRSFVVEPGRSESGELHAVGDVRPVRATVDLTGRSVPDGYHLTLETGGMTIATGGGIAPGKRVTSVLGSVARSVTGRPFATFPDTTWPPFLTARTIVLLDPAPGGVEEVDFRDLLGTGDGDRIREKWKAAGGGSATAIVGGGGRGLFRALGGLSAFAVLALVVAGTGVLFLVPHAGFAVALFAALLPALLAGADRIALASHEAALADDRPAVRAAAMAGLATSPFYAPSGREILRTRAAAGDEIAGEVLRAVPEDRPRPRRRIGEEEFLRSR